MTFIYIYAVIVTLLLAISLTVLVLFVKRSDKDFIEITEKTINALHELSEVKRREIYLLKTLNEAMEVTEPKRFIVHKMSIAPFNQVDYEDTRIKS